jgi:hypothetical protein
METALSREEVLTRYRELRAVSIEHHNAALKFLSCQTIMEQARSLGLSFRGMLAAESDEELTLIFDMALYSAAWGRSRALDRYARAKCGPPGNDSGSMLDAMRSARFSIWRVERMHGAAGVIVLDTLRETEAWLVDEGLERCAEAGMCFAARLYRPEDFSMTSGVIVPVDPLVIQEVAEDDAAWRREKADAVADDPRFAASVYRAAIAWGAMENVRFQ